ncbi:MAG: HlyD family efflux transporter periplasmic adaptor subunit, partial [Paraglaciecola sp.]|uniref:efflux RND transporter periplasmic adaptor subunit n=1 Tax=Paraglaciecola sp. TaxID=1920173 RepID=UPI003298F357
DFGQVLSATTQVAEIYSTDTVEIRLPINNSDIDLVNFPEEFRSSDNQAAPIEARFTSSLSENQTWLGKVTRTEAAIDSNSQQLYIVAQIEDPYNQALHPGASIKIGQYVNAEVQGKTIEDALVISNSAIYQGTYVYIVEDNLLKRKDITIRWQNGEQAIIDSGLTPGDLLVTTPLGQVSSGTKVTIAGDNATPQKRKPIKEQLARLQKKAEELGISVEELRAQRQGKGSGIRPQGQN